MPLSSGLFAMLFSSWPAGAVSPDWSYESNLFQAYFGSVAGAGDVNGDGFDDVIIGAHKYTNGETDEGRAQLFMGSASGLAALPTWSAEPDVVEAWYGLSVASAGDVNADGFDDVVIGAPRYSNGEDEEGAAFLFLGTVAGPGPVPAWSFETGQVQAWFGYSVSGAGDVNGDGFDDVVIGALKYDAMHTDEGAAALFLGGPAGLAAAPAWFALGGQADAEYGRSVASAGDVNGDGFDDVVIGAPRLQTVSGYGSASVYLGSATGLVSTPAWVLDSTQTAPCGWYSCPNFGDELGYAVSGAGDVDGDGFADVLVGAHWHYTGGVSTGIKEGNAFLYRGAAGGLAAAPAWIGRPNQPDPQYGKFLSGVGDVNGDGFADVVVAAPGYDNPEVGEGAVALYTGSPGGLSPWPVAIDDPDVTDAQYGRVAGAGDVNGDGLADVIIGAPSYSNGETREGAAFLYLGRR